MANDPLRRVVLACIGVLAFASVASAASPVLSRLDPCGGQRGTDVELTLSGDRLADAQEIVFYTPGFTVTKLEPGEKQVKATVKIAPDCKTGEHAVRLRTASGLSDLLTFSVGMLPTVAELEPNSEFAAPQKIDLNVTASGVVLDEDVDYYMVHAAKGQRLTAEIEGIRLGLELFDPYIAILDSKRFELSACDDAPLLRQDAFASVIVPEDGDYIVEVRDSAYGGSDRARYRLHVGTFPRPTAALPSGGKIGQEVEVRLLGDAAGEIVRKVQTPGQADPSFTIVAEDAGGASPSPVPFRVSDLDNALEAEPNNAAEQGTIITAPVAANGVIAETGDTDCFRFTAKKGEVYDVQCYARRIRSRLDPVLSVSMLGGGQIAANDDTGGPDSYFRFTAPEDKEYVLAVRDHLGRGGADFVYRIEVSPVRPALSVTIPKVQQYSQERQTIVVPKGNRYAALMAVTRADCGGDVALEFQNLPAGVTVSADAIRGDVTTTPVLFEATADAAPSGTLADVTAKLTDPNQPISGGFTQATDLIQDNNRNSLCTCYVKRLAVAVAEEAPFSISIVEPKAPLVQNGSMGLKVVVQRKPEFKDPIKVQMLFNPPGVSSSTEVMIPEGQNEAVYPLNAAGNASVNKWKIAVVASAPVAGGPVWVSSQLANLEVAPAFVQFAMERAATDQGKDTQVFCKVTLNVPYEGAAKARLLGLPPNVTAPEVELNKGTAEVAFPVTVPASSPVGKHQNIICQVELAVNGEPVVQTVGSTELRIDQPPPPKADAPPPAQVAQAAPPQPQPAPEKRLTRLEQLRLNAQEKLQQ